MWSGIIAAWVVALLILGIVYLDCYVIHRPGKSEGPPGEPK